jgi:tetratricopeptide (TPR) repeat protein
MSKKKRRRRRKTIKPASHKRAPSRLVSGLSEADTAMRRKRWDQAREILQDLDRRHPNRIEVLSALVNVYYELHDTGRYQSVCEQLLRLTPHDPDITLMLAGAYLTNMRPMLALNTFHRFLDRWPDHEQADEVRETVADIEAGVGDLLTDLELPGEDGLELAALHEEAQSLLEQGKYPQARKVAQRLLHRHPDFAPALNNISLTYLAEGRLNQAIATAQRVLAFDPDNVHALSNLTRYLCMSGRVDEAKEWAEQLKAIESDATDVWLKKAEALSYVGDDQSVLDAFSDAERAGHLEPPFVNPVLYHLAAVAAMRLERENQARRYWKQALKLSPGLELARDNLSDLRKPAGERHAPWPFSFPNWVTQKAIDDLGRHLEPAFQRGKEEAVTRAARRYLRQHPEIVSLAPLLFDRGDPMGREFVLHIARAAGTPEMQAALRDFSLSQRGPDEMRNEAARITSEAGLLPSGPVRLWMQGEWREILLLAFELHEEPDPERDPQVEQWLAEATLALQRRDADEAERLLEQALEIEPDVPALLNNLAAAYEMQGRFPEAKVILRQLHQRYPDYVFARTGMAQLCISRGQIDEAEALLKPLLTRRRLHFSEFAAFCVAQIQLFLAQDNLDAARSWLDMWTSADPDHHAIAEWRRRLDKAKRRRRFFRHYD